MNPEAHYHAWHVYTLICHAVIVHITGTDYRLAVAMKTDLCLSGGFKGALGKVN